MGSQYIPPPEQNVVNVGDEISINALQGIQLADPAITSTNPAATVNSVASAIAGKANLSGAAFTGRISVPPRTSASDRGFLNIGTVLDGVIAPSGANLVEGDIYFFDNDLTSGSNQIRLGYAAKNTAGVISHYAIATLSQSNQFTNTNVFQTPASTTAPTVRITQLGTGHALVVEDETANADTTPFVIGTDGRVGIHGTPAVNTNHKLAIYNGNIVFSAGYGLAFGDGTTQTTAAVGIDNATATKIWLVQNFWAYVSHGTWDSMMNRFTFHHSSSVIDQNISESGAQFSVNGSYYPVTHSASGEVGISVDATGFIVSVEIGSYYLPGYSKSF